MLRARRTRLPGGVQGDGFHLNKYVNSFNDRLREFPVKYERSSGYGRRRVCQQSETFESVLVSTAFLGCPLWLLWCSPCFLVGVFGPVFPWFGWVLSLSPESDGKERCRVRHGSAGAATCNLRRLASFTPLFLSVRSWVAF